MSDRSLYDCIIIGGGPAGLTAGLYLARFRRNILIYDTYTSRANKIVISNNYPGFPEGISGKELLERLRKQISFYKVPLIEEKVEAIKQLNKHFMIKTLDSISYTRNVILATGIEDKSLALPNISEGITSGLIRYCPVCDAYEAINKHVAVLGEGTPALEEALYLSDFTEHVTLISTGTSWSKKQSLQLQRARISVLRREINKMAFSHNKVTLLNYEAGALEFDCVYFALGCVKNNKLASDVNATLKQGLLVVNKKQQTSVAGLFAAGDVVSGLNQLCVATSQAAIAATAIHTRCRQVL